MERTLRQENSKNEQRMIEEKRNEIDSIETKFRWEIFKASVSSYE